MSERDFRDLEIWQEAHLSAIEIYKLSNLFPKDELYGLTSQIRRAAVSVVLNIAEGYGRHHYADEIKFLYTSRGSIAETQACLLIAKDLKYLGSQRAEVLFQDYSSLSKRINGLISYKKKQTK